jgi:hypothetical protein
MATINPFQQYSQGENTVTNNVLLMFSMLYEINPRYYEEYVNGLIEESEYYNVVPVFRQQFNNNGNGFIDGHIKIQPSTIIIETKLDGLEWIEKLLKYTDSFMKDENQLLFHLSKIKYDEKGSDQIKGRLSKNEKTKNVKFVSLTYKDLLIQLGLLKEKYPYEPSIQKLFNQFDDYISTMNLIPDERHILRAMACGQSYPLNIKHQFYFDLNSRGYRKFDYLGIYYWKAVRYLGEVENTIVADYNDVDGLIVHESTTPVTPDQQIRLKAAILDSLKEGWNIDQDHRFFLLKDFEETNFVKRSFGGIFRVRYFYLESEPGIKVDNTKQIAADLRSFTWE